MLLCFELARIVFYIGQGMELFFGTNSGSVIKACMDFDLIGFMYVLCV